MTSDGFDAIVDVHTHLAPPAWQALKRLPPSLLDEGAFVERKRAAGITTSVVLNAMLNLPGTQMDETTVDSIRRFNEFVQGVAARNHGSIVFFTGANPLAGEPMLRALEDVLGEPACRGICVNSSHSGRYLDTPEASEFWALAEKRGMPVFVHPPGVPPGAEAVRDFRLVEGVVRAHDTALGIAALVLGGVLDRHPRLRLIAATGGGSLALLRRRLDLLQGRPPGGPPGGAGAGPPALPRPPSSYLDQVYVDTCVYDPFALEVVVRAFGAQRVLFGTDWPPVEIPAAQLIDQVRSLPVTVAERTAIMGGNASRLLSLEASTAAG